MKFNKLILATVLVTPLFMGSCNPGAGKIINLPLECVESIYGFTNPSIIYITSPLADAKFVANFKNEYLVFDDMEQLYGKTTYECYREGDYKIRVEFSGVSSDDLPKDQFTTLNFKIKKEAFQNNILVNDATGNTTIYWDEIKCDGYPREEPESINESSTSLKISILLNDKYCFDKSGITLKDYQSEISVDDIKKVFHTSNLTGKLLAKVEPGFLVGKYLNLYLQNLDGLEIGLSADYLYLCNDATHFDYFNNMPTNYGFKIGIKRITDGEGNDCYTLINDEPLADNICYMSHFN